VFDMLLETGSGRNRAPENFAVSLLVHTAIVSLAVIATWSAREANVPLDKPEVVIYTKPVEPPEVPRIPVEPVHAAVPKGFQIVVAPVVIPDVLPPIDLSQAATDDRDFVPIGVPGGRADGVRAAALRQIEPGRAYDRMHVDKPAVQLTGVGTPAYPDLMRSAGVEGEVLVSFVIDTAGRAEVNTLQVLKSTHRQFTDAVRDALPSMRFLPAEVAGAKVRQIVQLPFQFTLR
jgi:protein TonB